MSPSAASFALTCAVIPASSSCSPAVCVELQATMNIGRASARQMTKTRDRWLLAFILYPPTQCEPRFFQVVCGTDSRILDLLRKQFLCHSLLFVPRLHRV